MTRTGDQATRSPRRWVVPGLAAAALTVAVGAFVLRDAGPWRAASAQEQVRTIAVSGRGYAFQPAAIEVRQDQLVRIVFTAEDAPYSFTIDEYRIAKRASPGTPVSFEFRADQAGRFVYYCNLKSDERCRDMLTVASR